jgi:hypothetical protein
MSRRERIWYCVKVFLAVRVGLMLVGYLAVAVIPARTLVSVPGWADTAYSPGLHNLFTAFEKQDALWFLRIASAGYRPTDGSAAFFPLYPLVVRLVSALTGGHPLTAALLVSCLAFLLALIVLFDLTASELSEEAARRTVLYLAIFPTAFFFFAPYSESLFLLLAVLAFRGARTNRWWIAGLAGAGAAATRSIGLVLVLALVAEAFQQRRDGRGSLTPKLAWAVVPAAGTLAYLGYWATRGNWRAPLEFQSYWQRHPAFPVATLVDATRMAWVDGSYWLLDWIVVVPVMLLAVYAAMRFRPAFGIYTWAGIIVPLCLVLDSRPLMSLPRFVAVLFPLFWAAATLSQRRRIPHELIVGVSAAGLALMATLFVNAWFVF